MRAIYNSVIFGELVYAYGGQVLIIVSGISIVPYFVPVILSSETSVTVFICNPLRPIFCVIFH